MKKLPFLIILLLCNGYTIAAQNKNITDTGFLKMLLNTVQTSTQEKCELADLITNFNMFYTNYNIKKIEYQNNSHKNFIHYDSAFNFSNDKNTAVNIVFYNLAIQKKYPTQYRFLQPIKIPADKNKKNIPTLKIRISIKLLSSYRINKKKANYSAHSTCNITYNDLTKLFGKCNIPEYAKRIKGPKYTSYRFISPTSQNMSEIIVQSSNLPSSIYNNITQITINAY